MQRHRVWLPLLLLLLWPLLGQAQTTTNELTSAQLQLLKQDILTNAGLPTTGPTRNDNAIAAYYNVEAAPQYFVWKSTVTRTEMIFGLSSDGTKFDPSGVGFLTKTVQELMFFESLFDAVTKRTNPMNSLIRDDFATAMSGATAPAPANRQHMAAICKRFATRAEKLFVQTGTCPFGVPCGDGSKPNPSTMTFEGALSSDQVAAALALP